MNGIPSNIAPADIAPSELPDGFSLTGAGGSGSSASIDQSAQRDAQRQAILEQAMTPEALARLRRVKVGALKLK
jgi:programmed cell death protein 5